MLVSRVTQACRVSSSGLGRSLLAGSSLGGRGFATPASNTYQAELGLGRVVNLSAGCAALPLEVLERAQKDFVNWQGEGISPTEMGYRTQNFYKVMEQSEETFRKLMNIPDTHEVHFFNGGATLQFAAIPMNLLGPSGNRATTHYKTANYVRNGHWSEKARDEARMYCHVHEVNHDPKDLYFDVPEGKDWNIDRKGAYLHYTAADTRQGFEFQDFPYDAVPEGMTLCCDASANLGSKPVDVSKYGVLYAAAHKNFSTSGVCYTIIRKDLIDENVLPGTPTMCNWNRFQTAPNKVWTVPVIFSVWMGQLTMDWMLERGGLPFFEDLAIRRSNLLYDLVDNSDGFYRCFVNDWKFRSRMQVVFTIRTGEGADEKLVQKFLDETEQLGWLDVRSHPLGIASDAIRITMYNPQPYEVVKKVRDFMHDFKKRNM
jgi:phosphoserine aminotransferase